MSRKPGVVGAMEKRSPKKWSYFYNPHALRHAHNLAWLHSRPCPQRVIRITIYELKGNYSVEKLVTCLPPPLALLALTAAAPIEDSGRMALNFDPNAPPLSSSSVFFLFLDDAWCCSR